MASELSRTNFFSSLKLSFTAMKNGSMNVRGEKRRKSERFVDKHVNPGSGDLSWSFK